MMLLAIIGGLAALATLTVSFAFFSSIGDKKKQTSEESACDCMEPLPVEKREYSRNEEHSLDYSRGERKIDNKVVRR